VIDELLRGAVGRKKRKALICGSTNLFCCFSIKIFVNLAAAEDE